MSGHFELFFLFFFFFFYTARLTRANTDSSICELKIIMTLLSMWLNTSIGAGIESVGREYLICTAPAAAKYSQLTTTADNLH